MKWIGRGSGSGSGPGQTDHILQSAVVVNKTKRNNNNTLRMSTMPLTGGACLGPDGL